MMKLILSALALLAYSTAALAAPAVGDAVSFQGTWGSEAVYQHLTYFAWNPSTRQFSKRTTTKIGTNAPATQDELVNFNDAASDAALSAIVNNCAARGGEFQTISVPAGTFRTCKMLIQGNWYWIAEVPFGVARVEAVIQRKQLVAVLTGVARGTNP